MFLRVVGVREGVSAGGAGLMMLGGTIFKRQLLEYLGASPSGVVCGVRIRTFAFTLKYFTPLTCFGKINLW